MAKEVRAVKKLAVKSVAKKAVAKKAVAKKATPSSMSAKAHQKDFASMSAASAARKELSRKLKPGQRPSMDMAGLAYGKADMRASKSFGMKSDQNKSRY